MSKSSVPEFTKDEVAFLFALLSAKDLSVPMVAARLAADTYDKVKALHESLNPQ